MNIFKNIPSSMNGLLVVMGVLAPLLLIGASSNPALMGLWTTLYIAIGAIGGIGVFIFERSQKNKADDFSKSVETNAASAEGVKDPQKIAQMDHMRKEFQRGIDIYKKHGKDLYSLPWYVVVGESESGKTEMLRRSEIGFPDKLQDRWQGSGGTLSMHWWFSNKAVILDTAGRLFVTEGTETGQSQWVNFLQMLKKNRPDCPINGLILVIPSNRLLIHPNPELEANRMAELDKNAGQIAKQMETLQAELGVRFPVYILITKMDKLNGFREFFSKIDKPEDRYQILGWSNPAPLGENFDCQSVAEYMHSVADRLKRRMMSELRNVEPENTEGLRIDEVDGLYAFPSSFEAMSAKLTRYLRHVFTTDEWSSKPPFLRGIYFTSALQQGMVLDEALAAAMGVPFERMDSAQQDDGLSLSKNRTYFVRDLFLDKIFNEKGLVTTASKIRSQISGWKLWLPVSALLILALVGGLGYWAVTKNDEAKRWVKVIESEEGRKDYRIAPLATFENHQLRPAKTVRAAKLLNGLEALGPDVKGRPRLGWVFTPAQWFDRSLSLERQYLYTDLVAETLSQLEQPIIAQLTADADAGADSVANWDRQKWEVLHALVILQHGNQWDATKRTLAIKDDPEATWPAATLLKALFDCVGLNDAKHDFPKSLENSIWHALSLSNSKFQGQLAARQGDSLRELVKKLLPVDQLQKQKDSVVTLNEFHRSLLQLKGYDAASIDKLAAAASKLGPTAMESAATGGSESKRLANNPKTLLKFILDHPTLTQEFGYNDFSQGEELEAGAKALLAHDGALLNMVKETLELIKTNSPVSFNLTNIEPFQAATAPAEKSSDDAADAANSQKDAQAVVKKLTDLKREWFKTEFFPNRFKDYLKLPITSDADVGTNEQLLTLWKLCNLAEKWDVEKAKAQQLIRTFNYFFDTNKITATDVIGTLRPCQIEIAGSSPSKYSIKASGTVIAEFDGMDGEKRKPAPLKLDQALTFFYQKSSNEANVADGKVEPWELVKKIKLGEQYPWRYQSLSNACYDITIPGANLDQLNPWLKKRDFEPQR